MNTVDLNSVRSAMALLQRIETDIISSSHPTRFSEGGVNANELLGDAVKNQPFIELVDKPVCRVEYHRISDLPVLHPVGNFEVVHLWGDEGQSIADFMKSVHQNELFDTDGIVVVNISFYSRKVTK